MVRLDEGPSVTWDHRRGPRSRCPEPPPDRLLDTNAQDRTGPPSVVPGRTVNPGPWSWDCPRGGRPNGCWPSRYLRRPVPPVDGPARTRAPEWRAPARRRLRPSRRPGAGETGRARRGWGLAQYLRRRRDRNRYRFVPTVNDAKIGSRLVDERASRRGRQGRRV